MLHGARARSEFIWGPRRLRVVRGSGTEGATCRPIPAISDTLQDVDNTSLFIQHRDLICEGSGKDTLRLNCPKTSGLFSQVYYLNNRLASEVQLGQAEGEDVNYVEGPDEPIGPV